MVAEGVRTTTAALALGAQYGVELPIAAEMSAVLAGTRHPREAVGTPDAAASARRTGRSVSVPSLLSRLRAGLAKTAQQIRERLGDRRSRDTAGPARAATTPLASTRSRRSKTRCSPPTSVSAATERILDAVRADEQGTLSERVGRVIVGILTGRVVRCRT